MHARTAFPLRPVANSKRAAFQGALEMQFGKDLNGWNCAESEELSREHPGILLWHKKWQSAGPNVSATGEKRMGTHLKGEVKKTWQARGARV